MEKGTANSSIGASMRGGVDQAGKKYLYLIILKIEMSNSYKIK
ncbi:MAG: hypothetical protein WBP45_02670 [Daejeonella sp.]